MVAITMIITLLAAVTACGAPSGEPAGSATPQQSEESTMPEEESKEVTDENLIQETKELPQILSLCKSYFARSEWQEANWLMYSEFANLSLWDGKERYPELDGRLSEIEGMQTRTMEEEAENILSFIQEMGDPVSEAYETQVSTLDIRVRRADSLVVSYLTDSYADYGFIEEYRGLWGSTYDARTGEEILLEDVIVDMGPVPEIVCEEINSHLWAGEPYDVDVVEDFFAEREQEDISWTLDYNGVTFYFGDGDLSEPGNGGISATVSFAGYPELFNPEYTVVPEAYMVQLSLDSSYFTDLNGDGTLEELNCSGVFNETDRFYSQVGIYTDVRGSYQYEELVAYGYDPYYVKTKDGNHYIYLFCEECEVGAYEPGGSILVVYSVNDGDLTKVGVSNVAPAYIPTDIFVLPLDPEHMFLDNADSQEQDAQYYAVGEHGMPVKN